MPPLPPETIQVRLRGTKRGAPSDDSDNTNEEYLRIQDEVSGNAVRYVYKRMKRPRTAETQSAVSQIGNSSATAIRPHTNILQPDDDHKDLNVLSASNKALVSEDITSNDENTGKSSIQRNASPRYHIKQRVPQGTQFSFAKPRSKNKPQVLFEARRSESVKERDFTIPTNTTPAPSLNQQHNVPRLAPLRNVRQASGRMLTNDTSAAEMDEAMRAYTLDSIGLTLANSSPKSDTPKHSLPPILNHASPSKFKPKPPAKRYYERHPSDEKAQPIMHSVDQNMMDVDDDSLVDDFIRVPIEEVKLESLRTIGVLVIDAQEDVEAFYGEGSDDEDEIYDEEEDENAENHPSTEYPDEEVDSDDEFDRNPYVFRKGSDDEEFDEDEATFSDEDEDIIGKMKSWSRKPAWMRSEREKEEAQEEEFDY